MIRTLSLTTAVLLAASLAPAADAARIRVVYDTSTFNVGAPVINNNGLIAFGTDLDRIYRTRGFSPKVIATTGDVAPPSNGVIDQLLDPILDNNNITYFNATATGSNSTEGIFRGQIGSLRRINRNDQAAPGGGAFNAFGAPSAGGGAVAFRATIQNSPGGPGTNFGIYLGTSFGPSDEVVRRGDAAPDANGTFLDFSDPAVNNNLVIAFKGLLTGASGGPLQDRGLYIVGSNGVINQAVREGDAAPDGKGTFRSFEEFSLNNNGKVAFTADMNSQSDEGVFITDANSNTTVVVRAKDLTPAGFGEFNVFSSPIINDSDQVAFIADLAATGNFLDDGIFYFDGTEVQEVVREGDAAPDGGGVLSSLRDLNFNDDEEFAFSATVVNGNSEDAIFFYSDSEGLLTVARVGDAFEGSTITSLLFEGGDGPQGNESAGLNDNGQIAYAYELANGEQGVVSWTVPEPSSLALLGLGGLLISRRRRG